MAGALHDAADGVMPTASAVHHEVGKSDLEPFFIPGASAQKTFPHSTKCMRGFMPVSEHITLQRNALASLHLVSEHLISILCITNAPHPICSLP